MYESVCYEKAFLREVIARIDLVAPLVGLEKNLPPKLASELSRHFPITEPPVDAVAAEFEFRGAEVEKRESHFKQWNFFGKEREKQLSLAPTFVFIKYSQYTTYEDMKARFEETVNAVAKSFQDVTASRFGLRYVNVIEVQELPTPRSWDEYFVRELLGSLSFFENPELLTRLFHIAELKYGDIDLRFQFGMPNPDYPAVMKRPQFVLDLDAYVRMAHEVASSIRYMDQAHERIQYLFERSITDKLRERMHARPAVTLRQ